MAPPSRPLETRSLPLKPEALILGGGIVAISIAQSLAKAGIHVTLLETAGRLGGKTMELATFYNRSEELQRWIGRSVSEIETSSNVTVWTRAELKRVDGHIGQFEAMVRDQNGTEITLSSSVIIVAKGYAILREKIQGLSDHKRVIGLSDMEKLLFVTADSGIEWEGKKVERITFLLDHVNEDLTIDSINAIKQGLLLQEKFDCQVAILCRNVKVSADGMERLYREAREKGVLFFKYEEPPRLSSDEGRIRIDLEDTASVRREDRWPVAIPSDLLVVGEAMVPDPETEKIARLLRVHLGNRGFLMEDNPQLLSVRSNRKGIFVAGGCRFPREVAESLVEAGAVAEEVMNLLSKGVYTYELAVAEVDPKKCAVCYTCLRLCPHSAIAIEKYAERNTYAPSGKAGETLWGAARVDPAACYGCGICVAECPARAITLLHLTDDQIYGQMRL